MSDTKPTLALEFDSIEELDHFVGGLLDGFGENEACYEWADGQTAWAPGMTIRVSHIDGFEK